MARLPRLRTRDDALRLSWWIALALLVVDDVIWPEMLGDPSTRIGGEGASFSLTVRWIPVALLAWMVVISAMRSGAHHRSSRLSGPYPTSLR